MFASEKYFLDNEISILQFFQSLGFTSISRRAFRSINGKEKDAWKSLTKKQENPRKMIQEGVAMKGQIRTLTDRDNNNTLKIQEVSIEETIPEKRLEMVGETILTIVIETRIAGGMINMRESVMIPGIGGMEKIDKKREKEIFHQIDKRTEKESRLWIDKKTEQEIAPEIETRMGAGSITSRGTSGKIKEEMIPAIEKLVTIPGIVRRLERRQKIKIRTALTVLSTNIRVKVQRKRKRRTNETGQDQTPEKDILRNTKTIEITTFALNKLL